MDGLAKKLKRAQILRQKFEVDHLFDNGEAINAFPLKAIVVKAETSKFLFSVPKRLVKKAVNRNLVRRRVKEACRVNQIQGVHIAWIYISKEIADYNQINDAVQNIFKKIGNSTSGTIG